MRVKDILEVKGNVLYTVKPECPLTEAAKLMDEHDIGSLVVMESGEVVGMLTFREVMQVLSRNGGVLGDGTVRAAMNAAPVTCTCETNIDEVRRLMLEGQHARYLPVLDNKRLMGVVSLYDVAKAVMEATGFENRMLKAYIRDWPESEDGRTHAHS
ncbi:CBS domain-containing protein [Chitinasiproducens palmae]|uniref:CBS domain-containing protein n=1 Tax=Chitinasiproducens palmae TaxID=1770053 RepID=A0A1H2PUY9_9BURK|nr:CBS domain-containing protein [Chitinasiproducens palmae]SDV51051.1 CBS domain-containing protein [Chitinasiproducens palmae]